jgi:hypothetical protein
MVVLICCITIFVSFISILLLLTYYFIKQRTLWNELFNINTIYETVMELFVCPEHFLIYIPGIILETTECIKKTHINNETEQKIKTLLTKINQCINKIELLDTYNSSNDNDNYNDNYNDNNMKTIKWILQGTMINYNIMFKETAKFFNKVSGSYNILNNNTENKNIKIDNIKNNNNLITLEKMIIIENNIEKCDTILNLLELINNNDYEILLQKENNYIICLISNLIEIIRMYKIKMCKIIVN